MTSPIMMYHSVDTRVVDPMKVQVTPPRLREQLRTLQQLGLRGVSMKELFAARRPRRLVGLTFDDGFADFACAAAPILAEFGFTATVFMVAGSLGGYNDWDPLSQRPIMRPDQLRSVHRLGHEVGSHGMRHRRLSDPLQPDALTEEVMGSKAVLEDVLQAPVTGFSYPYGAVGPEVVAAVRECYDYGCVVEARPMTDRWTVPRFYVGQADDPFRLASKLVVHPLREFLQRRTA